MTIKNIAIIAGGLATRLRPITEKIPKSMVEVAGKPFISHQLELIKRNNIEKVVICAGFMGKKIQDFVKDGSEYGLDIRYSYESEKLLGTGGAVRNALPLLGDIFWVLYGDSYLNVDFKSVNEYFSSNTKSGLMTVFRNDKKWDKSNIVFRDKKIIEYNKKKYTQEMNYIDYGLGILTKKAFEDYDKSSYGGSADVFDLASVYQDLLGRNELLGFEITERFYEIGSFDGLKETENYIKNKIT